MAGDKVFILACYKMSHGECQWRTIKTWQDKTRWDFLEPPPMLSSIPPIETVFRENALRGYLAMAIRRDCFKTDLPALDPMELRWYHPEGSATLFPTIILSDIHLAPPAELLKLLKCGCSSEKPCPTTYSKRCSCQANEISCKYFSHYRREEDCNNISII